MYSAFSKIVKYVFSENDDSVKQERPHSVDPDDDANFLKERTFSGKVTSLHNGYGIVDSETYFSFQCVAGGRIPRVGDIVSVTAKRKHDTGGWRAESVSDTAWQTEWKELADEDEAWPGLEEGATRHSSKSAVKGDVNAEDTVSDNVVAVVSSIEKDTGTLNDTVVFNFGSVRPGYMPYPGDWVVATVATNVTTGIATAEHIRPLREHDFRGTINSLQQGFGYIDRDIYFSFGVCEANFVPRRGEQVRGTAIECSRGRCTWRALNVLSTKEEDAQLQQLLSNSASLKSPTQTRNLFQLLQNKNNMWVSEFLDFGQMLLGQTKKIQAVIRNDGNCVREVQDCRLSGSRASTQVSIADKFQRVGRYVDDTVKHRELGLSLAPGSMATLDITCEASNLGEEKQLVIFVFDGFEIGREVTVSVMDPIQRSLDARNPYQSTSKRNYERFRSARADAGDNWLVPGQRPARSGQSVQLPNRLPQYPVPSHLEKCVLQRGDLVSLVPALGEELSLLNYTERFSALLHIEEIQQSLEMQEFTMERVCLRPFGEFLALKVPGLAEGRPSLLIGDRVILTTPGMSQMDAAPQYEGFVHEVLKDEILLKFSADFHHGYREEDYDVSFNFNRTTMRRCHQAVAFAPKLGEEVLFPTHLLPKVPQTKLGYQSPPGKSKPGLVKASHPVGIRKCPLGMSPVKSVQRKPAADDHQFYNAHLNTRQKAAVLRILSGQSRPTPYILFGPPGTGKTVTLVEAILQVFINIPSSRIIACAPSNSAADLLAERLHDSGIIKKSDLVRMNAFQRIETQIPESIKQYCSNGDNLELIARHRILVSTCATAGMMYALGLKTGHFTHAFVDEAGQATEPECLVPLGLVAGRDGQIVLSGDPMQLGPVLRSKVAKCYGLEQSFLERLIHRELYARDEVHFADHGSYDPLLVTKLVENYRCHPSLLEVSSRLFYHGELEVSAAKSLIECLCEWEQLPRRGFPVIFHGIKGEDLREGSSPSWFNPMEAVQVMRYLQALVGNNVHPLTFDDIGIITPYRKQVEKIRLLIDRLGMEKVKVGSVEEFQGQERLTMIISTVRSSESQVGVDLRHNLGFLSNPKRFNVSISRAQAAMIVVGNPHLLAQDPHWRLLLQFCVKHGGYIGCDLPDLGLEEATGNVPSNPASEDLTDRIKEDQDNGLPESASVQVCTEHSEKEEIDLELTSDDTAIMRTEHSEKEEIDLELTSDDTAIMRTEHSEKEEIDLELTSDDTAIMRTENSEKEEIDLELTSDDTAIMRTEHSEKEEIAADKATPNPGSKETGKQEGLGAGPDAEDVGEMITQCEEGQASPKSVCQKASNDTGDDFTDEDDSMEMPELICDEVPTGNAAGQQGIMGNDPDLQESIQECRSSTFVEDSKFVLNELHENSPPGLVPHLGLSNSKVDLCSLSSDDGEQGTRNQSEADPDTFGFDFHKDIKPKSYSEQDLIINLSQEKVKVGSVEDIDEKVKVGLVEDVDEKVSVDFVEYADEKVMVGLVEYVDDKVKVNSGEDVDEPVEKQKAIESCVVSRLIEDMAMDFDDLELTSDDTAITRTVGTDFVVQVKKVMDGVAIGTDGDEEGSDAEWETDEEEDADIGDDVVVEEEVIEEVQEEQLLSEEMATLEEKTEQDHASPIEQNSINIHVKAAVEAQSETGDVRVNHPVYDLRMNCPVDNVRVNRPEEDVRVNCPEEGVRVNRPEEGVRVNRPEEDVRVNRPEEGVRVNHPVEDVRVNRPEEGVRVNHPVEDVRVNRSEEGVRVNHPVEDVRVNRSEEGVRVNHPEEDVRVNHPEEGVRVNRPEEDVRVNRPEEDVRVNSPEEGVRVNHPVEDVRVNRPEEGVRVNHPVEDVRVNRLVDDLKVNHPVEGASVNYPVEADVASSTYMSMMEQFGKEIENLRIQAAQREAQATVAMDSEVTNQSAAVSDWEDGTKQTGRDRMVADQQEETITDLERKLIRQVEYYFCDYNLTKDVFLQGVLGENEGWLPLEVLVKFNRMKVLSQDFEVIKTALAKSSSGLMQVSDTRIRRSPDKPLPADLERWREELKRRTVYVTGLPTRQNLLEVEQFFNQFGPTEHLELLPWQPLERMKRKILTQPVFVVYKSRAFSQRMLLTPNLKYRNRYALRCQYREDTYEWLFGSKKEEAREEERRRRQETRSTFRGGVSPRGEQSRNRGNPQQRDQPPRFQNCAASPGEPDWSDQSSQVSPSHAPHSFPDGGVRGKNYRRGRGGCGREGFKPRSDLESPSNQIVDAPLQDRNVASSWNTDTQRFHGNHAAGSGCPVHLRGMQDMSRGVPSPQKQEYYIPRGRGRALDATRQDSKPGQRIYLSHDKSACPSQTHLCIYPGATSPDCHTQTKSDDKVQSASSHDFHQQVDSDSSSCQSSEYGVCQKSSPSVNEFNCESFQVQLPQPRGLQTIPNQSFPDRGFVEGEKQYARRDALESYSAANYRQQSKKSLIATSLSPTHHHQYSNDDDYGLVQHDSDVVIESSSEESADED